MLPPPIFHAITTISVAGDAPRTHRGRTADAPSAGEQQLAPAAVSRALHPNEGLGKAPTVVHLLKGKIYGRIGIILHVRLAQAA